MATRPRPADDALGFYYDNAYSGEAEAGMRHFQTESGLGRLINRYRLAVLERVRKLAPADRLLDVGCSYGGFLRLVRQRTGARTSGLDLDAGSIAQAVDAEQTDYRVGLLTEAGYAPAASPSSRFWSRWSTTPIRWPPCAPPARPWPGRPLPGRGAQLRGLWRRVFRTCWLPLLIPQHLYHFTPKTLAAAFKAAGFGPVARHQTMFFPLEGVASLWIWLARVLRMPPVGSKPTWRTPFDVLLFLATLPLYLVLEIPSQALLRLVGLAGHQLAIARRDDAPPA
ncbi:MAG: hypothetical protein R3F43_24740 [bacterium]